MRLLSFSPSARSASSATRVALQSRSRSLSLSERTEKPPFGGLFLLRNGHRPVRNPASPVFSPAPGPIRTARNGLSAVGRYGHGRTSRLPRRTLWVRFRFQSGVQGRGPLGLQYVDSGRCLRRSSRLASGLVLVSFAQCDYRARVSDLPEKLIPARRDDLIAMLAFALTRDSRLARMQSAELLASIVAERIVDRLEASGYVVMRGPPAPGAGDRPRP